MTAPAVRLEDVRCGYGAGDVLRGVSLDIAPGEAVALLGPNGAGKTTLTRLLIGLVRPAAGRVMVGDWDAAARRPDELARRVGYAFQHADQQLFARTVREDVSFGPRLMGRSKDDITEALDELDLLGVGEVHPYDLPAPARKLVALAGVLAMRPAVLVLDEPTAGFDRKHRALVAGALRRRVALGITVLVVSHDLGFVAEVADRIVVVRGGLVAADQPARTLLRDAAALGALGLTPPDAAAVGVRLDLADAPVRLAECAEALRGARWAAAPS